MNRHTPYYRRWAGYRTREEERDEEDLVPQWMANEDWYAVTPMVSEFGCVVSMLPLLLTGLVWLPGNALGACLCIAAALASALYHARPYRSLLRVDRLCATLLILYMVQFFEVALLAFYAGPLALLCIDTAVRWFDVRPRLPFLHVVWHTTGALCVYAILSHASSATV